MRKRRWGGGQALTGCALVAISAWLAGCAADKRQAPSPSADGAAPAGPPACAVPREAATAEMVGYYEALAQVSELRYDEARPRLDGFAAQFDGNGDVVHAADAMFWAGFCCEKLDQRGEALARFQRVMARWPASEAARRAQQHIDLLTAAGTQ